MFSGFRKGLGIAAVATLAMRAFVATPNQCRVGTNFVSQSAERGRRPASGSPGSAWC